MPNKQAILVVLIALFSGLAAACNGSKAAPEERAAAAPGKAGTPKKEIVRTLTLGAYTTPREVYGNAVIPAFQKEWKQKTHEEVRFEQSYQGSGAQARAIIGGFEADVAALSLEPDVQKIADAGLIKNAWREGPFGGMVSRSIVVIGVRPGNPKGIKDWDDLAKPGLAVVTPNVKTSGGAMWNVLAVYGAAFRGHTKAKAGDAAAAEALLEKVLANVTVMDKGARESMLTFERGIGDAIITYENEVLAAKNAGRAYDYVIPKSTILIENPVAVVDGYAGRHGVKDVAEAFVKFLATPASQEAFAKGGYRPVDDKVAAGFADKFPKVEDLFSVRDFGGWPQLVKTLFADGAAYDKVIAAVSEKK
ncbi:MAG: sulfate ABC transporter substrate-binding protein [Deltaproteobacteria bacterium]|nr:sulfate ABC transporter substrate-binding protein [Deltaproteobacteria bacterium]